jgi:hypothetical protein
MGENAKPSASPNAGPNANFEILRVIAALLDGRLASNGRLAG